MLTTEAPTLFGDEQLVTLTPASRTIQEAFDEFHALNPWVYEHLVRLARDLRVRGATRIGIGMLFEVLRWQYWRQTEGDAFKLNNNYRSRYARRIMENEPDLAGIFEVRELTTP